MAVMTDTVPAVAPGLALGISERHESYSQLVWRKFRKSKAAIAGGLMVITLAVLAIFAEFFSPNPLDEVIMSNAFIPPHRIHFIDADGNFHWQPFTRRRTTVTLAVDVRIALACRTNEGART
jgi:hypothetical protein